MEKKWTSLTEIMKAMTENMRSYEKTGTKPWDASIAIVDLAYQSSQLLKLKMQMDNERNSDGKSREEILKAIEVELAEIIALSTFIAHELKLNLPRGFQSMLSTDAEKIQMRAKKSDQ